MIERSSPHTRVERFGLLAGLALSAMLMWPLRHQVTDQMFVHLHQARHLAEGRGLVFNLGERVYGVTSPLWVTLLADAIALGVDGVLAARVLGALATLASVALFFQLVRRTVKSPEVRALATLSWATHPWMLELSMSGREIPLAVALVLAGFVACTEGQAWGSRPIRTGALWALGALTRPEVVLLLVLWGVLSIVDARNREGVRRLLFGGTTAVVIYGAWLLFSRVYYGTFWPQILSSNALASPAAGMRLPILGQQARLLATSDLLTLAVLAVTLIVCGRSWWARRSSSSTLHVLPWLWIVLLPVLYATRGVNAGPANVALVAPILIWVAWRATAAWWLGATPSPGRARLAVVLSAVFAVGILARHGVTYATQVSPTVRDRSANVERTLVRWGEWFRDHAPPGAVVAAPEVGAIAYHSRLRVVDTSGRLTAGPPSSRQEVDASWLMDHELRVRPTFLVHRGAGPYELKRRSPAGDCLVPIGDADGWSVYRIEWSECERLADERRKSPS